MDKTYECKNIPENVQDVFNSFSEYVKDLPLVDLPDDDIPEPETFMVYRNSQKLHKVTGYGDIILKLSFYQWKLIFKIPNHKNNLALITKLSKTLCYDPALPFNSREVHCKDARVSFYIGD